MCEPVADLKLDWSDGSAETRTFPPTPDVSGVVRAQRWMERYRQGLFQDPDGRLLRGFEIWERRCVEAGDLPTTVPVAPSNDLPTYLIRNSDGTYLTARLSAVFDAASGEPYRWGTLRRRAKRFIDRSEAEKVLAEISADAPAAAIVEEAA